LISGSFTVHRFDWRVTVVTLIVIVKGGYRASIGVVVVVKGGYEACVVVLVILVLRLISWFLTLSRRVRTILFSAEEAAPADGVDGDAHDEHRCRNNVSFDAIFPISIAQN